MWTKVKDNEKISLKLLVLFIAKTQEKLENFLVSWEKDNIIFLYPLEEMENAPQNDYDINTKFTIWQKGNN